MPAGRKIEDEREARRCLRAAERRGLSAGAWARAHGVDGRSLHAWAMNIARRGVPAARRRAQRAPGPAAHALVELVPTATPPGPMAHGAARYVLVLGDARFEFDDDVSAVTLRRVIEALRSC